MLAIGDRAPSFTLLDQDGTPVSLADFRGRPVVLYFYPKDDTPGCTTQACGIRDNWASLQATGAVILGVSPDSPKSHTKFRAKFELPFSLLADTDHVVAEQFGTWGEKSLYGRKYMGVLRTTFVIDGDGVISHVFENVEPNGHVDQIREALGA
jgi:peroxiredoxin Q/BCP